MRSKLLAFWILSAPAVCALLSLSAMSWAQTGASGAVWTAPFTVGEAGAYACARAQSPIKIDGRVDEPAWVAAQRIEGLIVPPNVIWERLTLSDPAPAKSRTTARLLWDDNHLYFSAQLVDRDIYATHEKEHDPPFGGDDIMELFVKPSPAIPYYWEFHVIPTGGTRDYFYARRGAGGDSRWRPYDSGMVAAATVSGTINNWEDHDQRWTVEMAVPWEAFRRMGGRPKAGDVWTFLVSRYNYSVHLQEGLEFSAAAPLPRAAFHLFEHYPSIVFAP